MSSMMCMLCFVGYLVSAVICGHHWLAGDKIGGLAYAVIAVFCWAGKDHWGTARRIDVLEEKIKKLEGVK